MAAQGWQGAFLRRSWRGGATGQNPRATPAPDLACRQFTAPAPNRLWVADATRIPCGQGAFWLAAVRDAFFAFVAALRTAASTITCGCSPSRPAWRLMRWALAAMRSSQ